jgi:hypothetical protein
MRLFAHLLADLVRQCSIDRVGTRALE